MPHPLSCQGAWQSGSQLGSLWGSQLPKCTFGGPLSQRKLAPGPDASHSDGMGKAPPGGWAIFLPLIWGRISLCRPPLLSLLPTPDSLPAERPADPPRYARIKNWQTGAILYDTLSAQARQVRAPATVGREGRWQWGGGNGGPSGLSCPLARHGHAPVAPSRRCHAVPGAAWALPCSRNRCCAGPTVPARRKSCCPMPAISSPSTTAP